MGLLKKKTAAQKKAKKDEKKALKQAKTKSEKKAIKKAAKKDIKAIKKAAPKTKLGKGVSKIEQGLKKAVGRASDIPFAPLLPFKKVMTNALAERGISHDGTLSDIAPKFYQTIVKKSFEMPTFSSYYKHGANTVMVEHIDGKKIASSVAASGQGGLVGIAAKAATGDVAGAASGLINEILAYIRKLKDKKEKAAAEQAAGQPVSDPLTPEEEKVLGQAEQVSEEMQDMVKEEAENTVAGQVKEFIFSWKGAATLAAIVLLLYLALKKK